MKPSNDATRALGKDGPGHTINALGRCWTFHPIGQADKAGIESFMRARAFRFLRQSKEEGWITDEEYEQDRQDLRDRIAAGEYSIAGPQFVRTFNSLDGKVELVRLMLSEKHPRVTGEEVLELLAVEPHAVVEAIHTLHPEFAATEDDSADPTPAKAPRP